MEEGETLVGILLGKNTVTVDGRFGKRETVVYTVKVEGGIEVDGENGPERSEKCALWGSVDLDGKLGSLPIPSRVQVTYTGKTDLDGGKTLKVYSVQRDTDWNPSQLTAEDDDIPF